MDNPTKSKRIGIDARFYGPVGKGLGRYTQEVVDNVIKSDSANEYVIFLGAENYESFVCPHERVTKILADVRWYTWAEQILMPWYIWQARLDLIHFTHFNVPLFCLTKFIVTIHDLILIRFPTTRATTLGPVLYQIKEWGYRFVIWQAVRRAARIIAVSRFTQNDIIDHFRVDPARVVTTYEGVAEAFLDGRENTAQPPEIEMNNLLMKYNISGRYLLYVGNAYPHKNLEGLIRAFSELVHGHSEFADIKLVLVGKDDYFYSRIRMFTEDVSLWNDLAESKKIIFPGFVPDQDLELLYKKALAYIFPSFYEGFGLPPLEAMAHGCPVVSSNAASMPEILGDAALFFDPKSNEDMIKKMADIINNQELRETLIKRGYEQKKKYSWKRCAEETLRVYQGEL